jgi:hypothetical protein
MNADLKKLARIPFKHGLGVFESDGVLHEVQVAQTPLGAVLASDAGPDIGAAVQRIVAGLGGKVLALVPRGALARLPGVAKTLLAPAGAPARKSKVSLARIGIRASAVTLHSEIFEESQQAGNVSGEREERGKQERRPAKVLEDSIVVAAGKKKVRLTAKARIDEVNAIAQTTGFDPAEGHGYEPAPWALWRASMHYAPARKAGAVYLRYVLGDGGGVAILATSKGPLAWHVLNWSAGQRSEALVQAYHLLRVHALRRLKFDELGAVSVQGAPFEDADRQALESAIGVPVERVAGPACDGELVAFGLALGALEGKTDGVNLARDLQAEPSIFQLAPWGEASFLFSLFLCMYLVLHFTVSGLRQEARVASQQADSVRWARGVQPMKLKQELDALKREVDPLAKFLTRELSFAGAFGAVAETLPPAAWLVTVTGEDLFWEKNPNKTLGQRYLLMTAGAPSQRDGEAPPEINVAVHGIDDHPYLEKVLPRVKLADVNWRQQGGKGYAVFSLLALPKDDAKK